MSSFTPRTQPIDLGDLQEKAVKAEGLAESISETIEELSKELEKLKEATWDVRTDIENYESGDA